MKRTFVLACLSGLFAHEAQANYEFGDFCKGFNDQFCQQSICASCKYSWPAGKTWEHPDAACRCEYKFEDWQWGEDCGPKDGYCDQFDNCEICRQSWPPGGRASDPAGACRCQKTAEFSSSSTAQDDQGGSGRFPPLKVEVDGQMQTFYVVYPEDWSEAETDGATLTYDFNNRMYLSVVDRVDPSQLAKANLLGGSITFDVNLSQSGCGCITSIYGVVMPAIQSKTDPFGYCDAAQTSGYPCPEFDIMEANRYAFSSTAHSCNEPMGGVFYQCDRAGGCSSNVLLSGKEYQYGPGSSYTINTLKTFTVQQTYHQSGGKFTGYTTRMTQDGKEVLIEQKNCDYLHELTDYITQFALVFSNWASNKIDWLQQGICSGSCGTTNTLNMIENLRIQTGIVEDEPEPQPKPQPPPDQLITKGSYVFGNDCDGLNDQLCQLADCDVCKHSWPIGETWEHPQAACRCLEVKGKWTWGDACGSQDQYCSDFNECTTCKFTWPESSDKNDPAAACRCRETTDFSVDKYDRTAVNEGSTTGGGSATGEDSASGGSSTSGGTQTTGGSTTTGGGTSTTGGSTTTGGSSSSTTTSGSSTSTFPSLKVEVDGKVETLYIVYDDSWSKATTSDATLSYDFNNRMYLSKSDAVDPSKYYKADLLGGSVKFDVDLSQSGCGCLTALYTTRMPAVDNVSGRFKYCDAAQVGGFFCPEFDIMEANKYAFRSTGHTCDAPSLSGVYSNCDGDGSCSMDILQSGTNDDYGPGDSYVINTLKPFTVEQSYQETNGQFTGYTTVFTQEGRQVLLIIRDCDYLKGMSEDMRQLVFIFSNWGSSGLDWLQHDVCQGSCSTKDTLSTIKNLRIVTATGQSGSTPVPAPVPEPQPNEDEQSEPDLFTWGDTCSSPNDQLCQQYKCGLCRFSWPKNEQPSHPAAACRCQEPRSAANEWTWSTQECASTKEDFCGHFADCKSCKMSWPEGSTRLSSQAACRCHEVDTLYETQGLPNSDPETVTEPETKVENLVDPMPVFYYGQRCGQQDDLSLCNNDCWCHKSWPANDDLKDSSLDAACRCLPKQMSPFAYSYDDECLSNTMGACDGCFECKNSWPIFDKLRWSSAEHMCRCKPIHTPDLTYSNEQCPNLYDGKCGADCHNCIYAIDRLTGSLSCHCAPGEIRQLIWGQKLAPALNSGLCGESCFECRWSWEESDPEGSVGISSAYRCKTWEDRMHQVCRASRVVT